MNISWKKCIFTLIELFALFSCLPSTLIASPAAIQNNQLNWVEVSQGKLSTQIMFDFTNPILFSKKLNKKNFSLKINFPGMTLDQFKHTHVINQLAKLKKLGLISRVHLSEKNELAKKIVLALDFNQQIPAHSKTKNHKNLHKNKLLIKWVVLENPNRLIIDIFTQQKLDELQKKNSTLLQAHNHSVITDRPAYESYSHNQQKDLRIVIDAGHGGTQSGAQGFGLMEKNLTLDIARKTKSLLKQSGLNAILIRNSDATMSLVERSELASQLKADLFISIHVNATGKKNQSESGIETFHLEDRYHFPSPHHSGFVLMNLHNHKNLPTLVNDAQHKNLEASRTLATSIQTNLISSLATNNINVINRGVKSDGFRVLLRSSVPAALVEVGFLTNKQEALRLSQESYRTFLAQGIHQGIVKYLNSHS